ncbi:DGQHR domain-containing protein [Parasaccharibacter sp. TMW 2.1891]|uniref:DGQHR domain-containing protein n=1 Tax=Parasaccharibacter sp. TMW 2.1891 TaxID=2267836 RepID=UPI0020110FF9|nr:DGQHR domain-containing protein [Parasaccharibacter sp. TMW 2.1891]MCL1513747.1 DGQHR domain-containing protein [Parasaccharibacter sp. TMW 2.1891]
MTEKIRIPAIKLTQRNKNLYVFCMRAKTLWNISQINQRMDNKEEGYQRSLSEPRAADIKKYINGGHEIAPAIVITFNDGMAEYDDNTKELIIENAPRAAWIIDGQHRLRGSQLADTGENSPPIEMAVVAFIGLSTDEQIRQFVTINKEAKGVPTSLYYDLIKSLPKKSAADVAKEKASEIAKSLNGNQDSLFFESIISIRSPAKREISLTNFVRKIYPLLSENKGVFATYTQKEMEAIIDNYYKAMKIVFPNEFSGPKYRFFQTLGFGALINVLPYIFSLTLNKKGGFRVSDIEEILGEISHFKFGNWDEKGTGTQAERDAGTELKFAIKNAWTDRHTADTSVRLF